MNDLSFVQYRERIGATLTTRLNDAYSQEVISSEESPIIASFILERIDNLRNHQDLIAFLEELANKWPIFGPVLMLERSIEKKGDNDQAINQAEQLIRENKIEEALDLVEDANNSTNEGGIN